MTDFHDRERAEEAHWSLEQETAFRVRAKRDHLLGLWAAQEIGFDDARASAYACEVTNIDVEWGQAAMVGQIMSDLARAARPAERESVLSQLRNFEQQARDCLAGNLH